MSATVTLGDNSVTVDRIEPLFTMRFPYGAYHAFDVTKDGQRIPGEHRDHGGRRVAAGRPACPP